MQASFTTTASARCCGLSLPARHTRKVAAAVAKPSQQANSCSSDAIPWLLSASLAAAPLLAAGPASAAGGEFGILEGRTLALIHPAVMGSLFAFTLYTGWLGFQVRECCNRISNAPTPLTSQERPSCRNTGRNICPDRVSLILTASALGDIRSMLTLLQ